MTGTTHTSIQHFQAKFDTDGVSIGIYNRCSVTTFHFKKDFVGHLKNVWCVINGFEVPKVHTIYEVTIAWTIDDNSGHPHQVEIPNYLYVTKGCKRLISTQNWAHTATSANIYASTLDVIWCVINHDRDTLIWVGGQFVCTVPLYKQKILTLHNASGYIQFTEYWAAIGYYPYLNDDKPDYIPENLDVLGRPEVTNSTMLSPPHPYPPPEGEKQP